MTVDLVPYARNARTHSEALIASSIREYGFTNPVLVYGENGIIAGHGRVMAARQLGLVTVPVIELGHLSESQKRAYIPADNRLAEQADLAVSRRCLPSAYGKPAEGLRGAECAMMVK